MPIKSDREYRAAKPFEVRKAEDDKQSYIVEGYATTFNEPYVLFNDGEKDYFEVVDAKAFDTTDMSDVIFQYDHSGMVYARQKNNTLELEVDEHGLKVKADLGSTEESRKMYDAIKAGLVSEMSFAFTVNDEAYDKTTRTRAIRSIGKLYDVSAVSIPANPSTEISARSFINGVKEKEKQEMLEAEARAKRVRKIKLMLEVI